MSSKPHSNVMLFFFIDDFELIGTTAIAYHLKDRIHLVIDSREVHRFRRNRNDGMSTIICQKYYNVYDEKCILFSVYEDRGGPIGADIFASYFCKTEGIKADHCVDHREANNNKRGFYFHRLIFISSDEVESALSHLEDHSTGTKTV
ncbi:hypothetical protein OROGR_021303 [Orobanche gracilis]